MVGDLIPRDPREAYATLVGPGHPKVHPIGMSMEVFLKKLREGSAFVLEVLEDGKILYADGELLAPVSRELPRIRSKLRRDGKTWIGIA